MCGIYVDGCYDLYFCLCLYICVCSYVCVCVFSVCVRVCACVGVKQQKWDFFLPFCFKLGACKILGVFWEPIFLALEY